LNEPQPRTFYRVVRNNPPIERDFFSYAALGIPLRKPRPSASDIAAWQAVSTYVTDYAARKRAWENASVGNPLGDFIATLVIPENAPITIGPINPISGHCNLTGEPAVLLAAVVSVERV
jgi:hypothetical protein